MSQRNTLKRTNKNYKVKRRRLHGLTLGKGIAITTMAAVSLAALPGCDINESGGSQIVVDPTSSFVVIDGQTVTGEEQSRFTWNARMIASVMLPYDLSVQLTGNYRSRQVITQGYRKSNFSMEMGIKKNFFDRQLVVSLNCRDLLNSRKWKTYTSGPTFTREQENWRRGRTVNLTVTWNFGNMKPKRPKMDEQRENGQDDNQGQDNSGYSAGGEE